MIIIISWQLFQSKYLKTNTVFVKEGEYTYEFFTSDGIIIVKSIVEKSENEEENAIFLERHLISKANIVKVMEVLDNRPITSDEISESESSVAIREDDKEKDAVLFSITNTNDEHYHTFEVDKSGDGETQDTYPETYPAHNHLILGGIVQESNGHIHTIEVLEE